MLFRVRWSRLPLTQRLTLLFTAVAASVVLGLGALFLVETERHFVELDRVALQDKQHLIEDILRNANSADDARRRLGEALSYHHDLYAQVQDGQGAVVFQSRGFIPTMRGDKTPLAPGMCFSNEPMIVIPDTFGVRLEDHFHVTVDGAAWFTQPQPSLEKPFG